MGETIEEANPIYQRRLIDSVTAESASARPNSAAMVMRKGGGGARLEIADHRILTVGSGRDTQCPGYLKEHSPRQTVNVQDYSTFEDDPLDPLNHSHHLEGAGMCAPPTLPHQDQFPSAVCVRVCDRCCTGESFAEVCGTNWPSEGRPRCPPFPSQVSSLLRLLPAFSPSTSFFLPSPAWTPCSSVQMCVLDMTDWRHQGALAGEDKPSECCEGAKDTLASGGGLSGACLHRVLLQPEIKSVKGD
ncbi:unnamed protein product [Pleuronectes platessa]|uniref:Uncharacterized protein n=1 Tax=Pleuronectes platessa TaxID=8262 RepID=A0A9N7Y360_PLEPL|nr:unnamed protein product [Pleuronectes platessa]